MKTSMAERSMSHFVQTEIIYTYVMPGTGKTPNHQTAEQPNSRTKNEENAEQIKMVSACIRYYYCLTFPASAIIPES